ncbi:hypothetical protein G6F57_015651 [Rhizopus arrhizus]|nr:hypothetical protein G6F57_015651 [Rhizopus arrhizus]
MDQMVQPAEMLGRRLEHAFAVVRHGHIQRVGVDPLAAGIQLGRDRLQARVVDVGQHQPGAVGGHQPRGRQTNAIPCAGDDGHLSFERNHPVSKALYGRARGLSSASGFLD